MSMSQIRPRSYATCVLLSVLLAACSNDSSNGLASASGTAYHIDCNSTTASEGTIDAPWSGFEAANSITLEPGDRLLLRRGTTCNGMLKPQGSEPHRGVYLTSTATVVTNVEIRDSYIHDVTGLVTFSGTAKRGGAIIADSSFVTPQTQFDGVLIENNRIEDVGRSGIYFDGTSAG